MIYDGRTPFQRWLYETIERERAETENKFRAAYLRAYFDIFDGRGEAVYHEKHYLEFRANFIRTHEKPPEEFWDY